MDRRTFLRAALAASTVPLVGACNDGDSPDADPTEGPSDSASTALQDIAPDAAKGLQMLDAQPELIVGSARYSFGLLDPSGSPLTDADVMVYAGADPAAPPQASVPATWLRGGVEEKAIYVAQIPFTKAGPYFLAAVATTKEAAKLKGGVQVTVSATSASPLPGQAAISTPTPTTTTTAGADPLCSRKPKPCSMHALSLDAALRNGKPTVVVFAAPAFCTSQLCGPDVDIVEGVAKKHRGDANFIHVEAFVDATKPGDGTLAPPLKAFKFDTEPWLYVIDAKGVVSDRISGAFATTEVEARLAKVGVG